MMNILNRYTEDELSEIIKHLDDLKGKILLDDNKYFFMLVDYEINSETETVFNWFKDKKEVTMFDIKSLTFSSDTEIYKTTNEDMCSLNGVQSMMDYRLNYKKLEQNLMKFTLNNDIVIKFGIKNK